MSGYPTAVALTTVNTVHFAKETLKTAECHVVTDVQERKKMLRSTGAQSRHLARDCNACIKCFRCRGHYHVALCQKRLQFGGGENRKADEKVLADENDKG